MDVTLSKATSSPDHALIHKFALPSAVIDPHCRVLQQNALFAALTNKGSIMSLANNVIQLPTPEQTKDLRERVANALDLVKNPLQAPSAMRISKLGEGTLAYLQLVPIETQAHERAAFLCISEPSNEIGPSESVLKSTFDLSSAEARVARRLYFGDAPNVISERMKLSENTVRSHIRSILMKTETSRQSEVISLFHRTLSPGSLLTGS